MATERGVRIDVGTRYVITADPYCYILNVRKVSQDGKTKGQERLEAIGYYGKMEHLLDALQDKWLRSSDIKTLEDLVKKQKKIAEIIKDSLNGR